jgi:uncharacterized protein (TIGR02453 family)
MTEEGKFEGFSKGAVNFFVNLKKNNNKEWFEKNKNEYEDLVLKPARSFVLAMGERLKTISPNIFAVPKVNKSLFRLYRDTRFSPDKSPYKTNLGIYFWEGRQPRFECPGYYFHLEPPNLMFGVGIYMIPRKDLDRYRKAVVHPRHGEKLAAVVKAVRKNSDFTIGGKHYKRIPQGYDPDHPNGEYLLHNGLYAGYETKIPEEFYSHRLIGYSFKIYKKLFPLQDWLVSVKLGDYGI